MRKDYGTRKKMMGGGMTKKRSMLKDGTLKPVNPKTQKGKSEDAITKIFTENDPVTGEVGLLNSIIASKITLQMEQLPGFSTEDFISQTIAELIPHIRNFNPEINNSLTGWTNS